MSDTIQIRPLRFLRLGEFGAYVPSLPTTNPPAYGTPAYLTADRRFLVRKQAAWYIEPTYNFVDEPTLIYRAFSEAGFRDATFPTRRAAISALEALAETLE